MRIILGLLGLAAAVGTLFGLDALGLLVSDAVGGFVGMALGVFVLLWWGLLLGLDP